MDITPLGHASFRLKGKQAVVVTDPYASDMVGLKFPKHIAADIVTVSHDHEDHNAVGAVEGSPFVVKGPGEYEIKGVGIVGFSVFHDSEKGAKRGRNTMYRIELDGISVVHAGDLGHLLTDDQIEALDGVNVLMLPVGGCFTIDPAQASQIINEVEPNIVIPMHYGRPELNQQVFGSLAPLANFLKEIGKKETVAISKLTVTKDKLPDEMQIVVLE